MKVVLADPPRRDQAYDTAYPNLGILYLIGAGRERFDPRAVTFRYLEANHDIQSHLGLLAEVRPDLYGISYASFTSPLAHRTIRAVRERFPNLPIVAGGAHPTAAWESVMGSTEVDVCVLGEGEVTFGDVVEHFAGTGKPLEEIDGIAFRKDGHSQRTGKRPLVANIDEIPLPAWDLVDFTNYAGMHIKRADPQTYTLVSRGCPFDCGFCSNPIWKENRPWVRLRSPASIAHEIELLYGRGIREIYLSSDEFNVNYEWPIEVAHAIRELSHADLHFQCNVRADKVTPESALAFKEMRLWMVHIGIESGNQRTIDGLQKKIQLEQVVDACRVFQEAGVKVFGFMMLYHAWEEDGQLCFETAEDVDNTLAFARRLLKQRLINYMSWQVATPYPGSRLWETARKFGLITDVERFGDVRERSMCLPGVSDKDVRRSLRKGYILKNWYALRSGHISWRHLARVWQNLAVILGLGRRRRK